MRSWLGPAMFAAAQARRRGEWLTSPSPAAGRPMLFTRPA
jgi:hypothetical protein